MAGFLLIATREGKLLYISDNVTEYLGHSMVSTHCVCVRGVVWVCVCGVGVLARHMYGCGIAGVCTWGELVCVQSACGET